MATRRPIRDSLWEPAGFPNPTALEVALTGLARLELFRPSKRGTAANHLNARELAYVYLALRGEGDAERTKEIGSLVGASLGGPCLVARLANLIELFASRILIGATPGEVRLTLGFGPGLWADLEVDGVAEPYHSAAPGDGRCGIQKTITISPGIFEQVCEFAADSYRRDKALAHQGNSPGYTPGSNVLPKRKTAAGSPNPEAALRSIPPSGNGKSARLHAHSITSESGCKHFVCRDGDGLPEQSEGFHERMRLAS